MPPGSLLDWLERLQTLGLVRLSPSLVDECARIAAMEGVWRSREDLAQALASRLAHDERTYRAIREEFLRDRAVDGDDDERPPGENGTSKRRQEPGRVIAGPRPPPAWIVDSPIGGHAWTVILALAVVVIFAGGPSLIAMVGERLVPDEWSEPPELRQEREESARNTELREKLIAEAPQPPPRLDAGPRARIELVASPTSDVIETSTPLQSDPDALPGPTWLRWLLLVAGPVAGLFAGRWWTASTELRADIERAESEAVRVRDAAQAGGRSLGSPYDIARHLWFDRGKIDDAGVILARRRDGAPGDDLDVGRTLARTIDAGGRLSPVFAPTERRAVPVILVDTESSREDAGHPFLDAVDLVLARWRAGGLAFERHDFNFDPGALRAEGTRRALTLDEMARRTEGRPLLVFSRFRLPEDYHGALEWPRLLDAWPERAWIDLDPHTLAEHDEGTREFRQDLARVLPRFAFTADDLIRAARSVASGEPVQPTPERALPPVAALEEHLWKWAACAALVPDPSWPQLEAVRRELAPLAETLPDPRLVARLIEWAAGEGLAIAGKRYHLGTGARLAFDPARRRDLLARLRVYDDTRAARGEQRLETLARELLIRQLEAAGERIGDPFGEALRLAKLAFHRAILHPAEALEILAKHTDGAVGREIKELAVEELELQEGGAHRAGRWSSGTRRALSLWIHRGPATRLGDLLRVRAWSPRHFLRALPWAVLAALGAWLWWGTEAGRWDVLPQLGAPPPGEAVAARIVTTPAMWRVERLTGDRVAADDAELVALADVAPLHLVRLPGGEFLMGSPETEKGRNDDERQHLARVGPFAIGKTEVTLAQWTAVMGNRPNDCDLGCEDEHPVHSVTWNDACRFTIRLTERENLGRKARGAAPLTPCYVADGDTCAWPAPSRGCTGFRLPTEAEWEYAARAGTTTTYHFGDDPGDACKYANVDNLSAHAKPEDASFKCNDGFPKLAPVGKLTPNAWGLHDVHGNVWEWVWDWHAMYPGVTDDSGRQPDDNRDKFGMTIGYAGPENGVFRVLRGGSFGYGSGWLRAADRLGYRPVDQDPNVGFRVVRVPPSP